MAAARAAAVYVTGEIPRAIVPPEPFKHHDGGETVESETIVSGCHVARKRWKGSAHVSTYGRFGTVSAQQARVRDYAKNLIYPAGTQLEQLVIVRPPTSEDGRWHHIAWLENGMQEFDGEGVVTDQPRTAIAIPSRDCAVVVIYNCATGVLGAGHVGVQSLLSKPSSASSDGTVRKLLELVAPRGVDYSKVHAFVTAYITTEHYALPTELLSPFVRRYGEQAVPVKRRALLSLEGVITAQLAVKLPSRNIERWGTCTFADPRLGSYRAERAGIPGKEAQNLTIAVKF